MNHDVFISYSSQDKDAANAICHVLEENNIRCWIAPRDIPAGAQYGDLIDDAIKSCQVVVVLFSETAAVSQWVKSEMNIAFDEQKVIVPVRLDNTPLTGLSRVILNQKHWIDAYPDYKTKFIDLLGAVSNALGIDVPHIQKQIPLSSKFYMTKKTWMGACIILICVGLCFACLLVRNIFHSYSYDKNGLHVNVKNLTPEQETVLSSILDNMVLVEGGQFVMGYVTDFDYLTEQDSLSANSHTVKLGNYYICKYEVTQEEWKAFCSLEDKYIALGDKKAIDMLSWEDAANFAKILSEKSGLNFSLPTEAQWEYAARGGQESKGYLFSGYSADDESVERVAWTSFDNLSSAQDVGLKQYNELGLYDMTGNVSEWCLDYYAPYKTEFADNPQGPEEGLDKIYRGGDFRTPNLWDLKTTTRFYDAPFTKRKATGLRLVINIK